jgi:hypothetical protein
MSSIYHSGYGYSKKLCEDITSWFLNKYYPRHKIDVDIEHRGLVRENVLGYCDFIDNKSKPRHFLIELQTDMCKELYTKILFHELTHLSQWVDGSLTFKHGKMCYCKEPVENYDYVNQPHEIEARESESVLYDLYLNEKESVPVEQPTQGWWNRLCGSVLLNS